MENTTKYVHHNKWLYINDSKDPKIPLQQYRLKFTDYGTSYASVVIEKNVKGFWGWRWKTIINKYEIELGYDVIKKKSVYTLVDLVAYYTKYIVEGFRVKITQKDSEHTEKITYS